MKRMLPALLCAAALSLPSAFGPAAAQDAAPVDPVPQPEPVSLSWAFDFEHSTPDTIAIANGDGSYDWYWYMTYKVTNFDEPELFFDPNIVIQNDAGEIVAANAGVDSRIFNAVRTLLEKPLLLSPGEAPGRVFMGEDYARESVVIWRATQQDVDQFRIFIGGIYGETQPVIDPNTGQPIKVPVMNILTGQQQTDENGNPLFEEVLLHRTLMLHYSAPGTTTSRQDPSIRLEASVDVMR